MMNEQRVRKMLKKYDLDIFAMRYLLRELSNRKIITKSIRNKICSQGEKISKLFCLLKGSVQVQFKLQNNLKQKQFQAVGQSSTLLKKYKNNLKNEKNNILLTTIQNEYQIVNEEIIIQYLQKQEKRTNLKKQQKQQKQSQIQELSGEQAVRQTRISKANNPIKSKYSAVITSSQCDYIQLSFQQGHALVKSKTRHIKERTLERLRIINSKNSRFRLQIRMNQEYDLVQKLSLPNLILKNIHPANEIFQKYNQLEQKINRKNVYVSNNKNQVNKTHAVQDETQQMARVKSLSLPQSPSIRMKTVAGQLPNKFYSQQKLFDQNQLILQRYRSKKAFQAIHKGSYSQNIPDKIQANSIAQSSLGADRKGKKDLFKQNLKKIIRKKLLFQKKHGEIMNQFARNGPKSQRITNQHDKRSSSYRQIKSKQRFGSQSKGAKINMLEYDLNEIQPNPASKDKLQAFKYNSRFRKAKNHPTFIKNQLDQQNQMDKTRYKISQDHLLMHLQNLDSYFTKIA